jgi:hypothetical protein
MLLQDFLQEEDDGDNILVRSVNDRINDDQLIQHALFSHNLDSKLLMTIRQQSSSTRSPSLFVQRLLWADFDEKFRNRFDFKRH